MVDSAKAGAKPRFTLPQIPRIFVYIVGFIPALGLLFVGLFVEDGLGADPLKTIEHTLGEWALRFLVATLAITPLRQLTGLNLIRYRRAIGLLAFYYAAMHLATYVILDQELNATAIVADILKRPFITIGMGAFVALVPLAITSNNLAIRTMGGKAWARLHKLVYVIAIAAAVHFIMAVKSWPPEPLIYAGIVALLLGYRLVRAVMKPTKTRVRNA